MDRICDNCMSRVPVGTDKCPKCGIRFENTNPGGALPNGWVLGGRYTIGRYLDIDGEGVTYAAIDGNTLQRVHIKEYMPVTLCATRDETGAILAKPGCEVLFKTTRMDFAELFSILMRLGLVEGLVQVLDVLEENNTAYAVQEMVEGPTLAEHLIRHGQPLEFTRALALMRPVMMGLDALHAANVVHRGISPDNIILESGGTAKLTGYATLALRQQGSELKPKLYPGYSAPEQYSASEFEGRYTDVYALGAVLYRMMTGEEPVPADERKIQDVQPAARAINKEIPSYLSTAITRAMKVLPADRMQTLAEMRLALSGEGGRGGVKGGSGLTRQQTTVAIVAAGIIVLLLAVILLVSLLGGNKDGTDSSESVVSFIGGTSIVSGSEEEDGEPLPDFTGKLYTDVTKSNTYSSYVFATPSEVFHDTVAAGYIIAQTPEAGAAWDGVTPIQLVVSKGSEANSIVPDLVGKLQGEAASTLRSMGINFREQAEPNDGTYAENEVIRTDPAAGTAVDKNTTVTVFVAEKPTTAKMPEVLGKSEQDAKAALDEYHIQYTIEYVENDGEYVPRQVLNSTISQDATIDLAKDKVSLKIADDVLMPDITGMSQEEAQVIIDELRSTPSGVSITLIFLRYADSTKPDNVVFNTDRDGGTIKNGDQVNAVVFYTPDDDGADPGP